MGVWILGQSIHDFIKKLCEEITDFVLFGLLVWMNEDKFIPVECSCFGLLNAQRGEVRVEFFAGNFQEFELVNLLIEFGDGLVFIFEGRQLPLLLFEGINDDVGIELKGEKVAVNLFFELPVFIHRIHPYIPYYYIFYIPILFYSHSCLKDKRPYEQSIIGSLNVCSFVCLSMHSASS